MDARPKNGCDGTTSDTNNTLPAWVTNTSKPESRAQPWKAVVNARIDPNYAKGEDILDLDALGPNKEAVAAASHGSLAA